MGERIPFSRALVVIGLALVGGQAVYWFITPQQHPDASTLRTIGVGVQAVLGFGGAAWAARQGPTPRVTGKNGVRQ